ncbi:hypothetical protein N7G274_009524 [Stereocaulon virgatum]|uniref:Heterokaryon incompatibility domain-containing protein n=1 Tax=Stereocaulon virgatum TaxID=373712 RepID=A0ABR3ZW14_9LECA
MGCYEYSPLNEEASEIRLMKLLPGRFRDRIRITLETATFTKTQTPQYEALSYVWGSKENPVQLSIKTEMTGWRSAPRTRERAKIEHVQYSTLSVTRNLGIAVRHLRRKDEARILWIDAICVDQRNIKERGHQVARMADVYSLASRVVVWLGPETGDSALAIRNIDGLGSQLEVDWHTYVITSNPNGEINWPDVPWNAIIDLLNRSWFERLWVFQEVRLANTADVLCGDQLVSWEAFRRAVLLSYMRPRPLTSQKVFQLALALCSYVKQYRLTLKGALYDTRHCVCSDPRDRIYAILSLVSEHQKRGLVPDYSKTTEEVFQDVILHEFENLGFLSLLTHCEMRKGATSKPSWVPDWTAKRECVLKIRVLASSTCQAQARYICPGVLAAKGVHVTSIKSIVDLPDLTSMANTEREESMRGLILTTFGSELPGCNDNVDALCRTLCCDLFAERSLPRGPAVPEFVQCRKYVLEVTQTSTNTLSIDSPPFYYMKLVRKAITGRVLFITNDGLIGLAPRVAMPGDEVCVIFGCSTPLVLRPNTAGCYQVVGECYGDGYMDGAALLGPLSSEWRFRARSVSGIDGRWGAFFNAVTGNIQVEDPRLGPLPAGWRVGKHAKEAVYNLYENTDTGEQTCLDPRTTPDALKARGVDIKEFKLV